MSDKDFHENENENINDIVSENTSEPSYTEQDVSMETFSEASGYERQKISSYYYKRRKMKNKLERKVRQNRMWLGRLRVLLRLAVIFIIGWVCYKSVYMSKWYLDPNIFFTSDNRSLEIVNNKIVPKNKILAALRKTTIPHIPIYKLETDEIKQNVMQLDPIEDVFVRRFWFPARLQIIIEEKTPIITISPSENVPPIAFFADDGTLIGREYLPLNPKYKTILVLSYGTRGDDYRSWKYDRLNRIVKLEKAVKLYSKENVKYIDFRNPRDIYVRIDSVNIRIGLLDDTVYERVKRISSILPQVKTLEKPIKYIDLRWKDANYIKLDS